MSSPRKLILAQRCAAGDTAVSSGLVRDLALAFPGQFQVDVDMPYRSLLLHNPHLTRLQGHKDAMTVRLTYGDGIGRSKRGEPIHFLRAFHDNFKARLGVDVPLLYPKPDLHLSEAEKAAPVVAGRYWVVIAGGKHDFPAKVYACARYQQVVTACSHFNIHFVQAGALDKGHSHPRLTGVTDLVGKTTDIRELLRLIYHADGVLCGVTLAMHVAAAFDKPAVIIAGGREAPVWEAYHANNPGFGSRLLEKTKVNHRYLHTLGQLYCQGVETAGCWKSTVLPEKGKSQCVDVRTVEGGQPIPHCLARVTVAHVVDAILSYYKDGTLPPLGPLPTILLPDGTNVLEAPAGVAPRPLEVLPRPAPVPAAAAQVKQPRPAAPTAPADGFEVLDHPAIGGKLTLCVLYYGDYFPLATRSLEAILATTPRQRLEVRVAGNAVCEATRRYLQGKLAEGAVSVFYDHLQNIKKYPAQRLLWHDPERPLTTRWTAWFDDDTFADIDGSWLRKLAECIIAHPEAGAIGPKFMARLKDGQVAWVKQATWYRGRPLQDQAGKPQPNGNCSHFVTGSLFAIQTEAIRKADLPDVRLGHNGGDVAAGVALWQNGYTVQSWSQKKEIVAWSAAPRRGLSEKHFGM